MCPSKAQAAMSAYRAVILAGGKGLRMRSDRPKVLHKICGEALINMVLSAIEASSITDPTVTVVPCDQSTMYDTIHHRTEFAVQREAKGSGHALLQAKNKVGDSKNIVVLNGDVPFVSPKTINRLICAHQQNNAHITLLTSTLVPPKDMGRIFRTSDGEIQSIIESGETNSKTSLIDEVNAGLYCFKSSWLWEALEAINPSRTGEFYITDLVKIATKQKLSVQSISSSDELESMGINTRLELSLAENLYRKRLTENLMISGVTLTDPATVYIDQQVIVEPDTVILPNTHLKGTTKIRKGCTIGPNTIIEDTNIGSSCTVRSSVSEGAVLEDNVTIGPFSHIRKGSLLERNVRIGNYAEIKNSHIGENSRSGHYSYIGDARVGREVNIGAGTITCNYDGNEKHLTTIGDHAFIGCNTMLVAPINIGQNSVTGTGSVINKDVPPYSKAIGSPARIFKNEK